MASSAKHFSLFLLLTLLSSLQIHARDSQFFNKIPSTTNKNVIPIEKEAQNNQQEQQDPKFLPENGNGYGLYGHESGQLPPSATTGEPTTATTTTTPATTPLNAESKQPVNKYLPKNYNPVAYVTVPEGMNDNTKLTKENSYNNNNNENNYYNGEENNYNNQQQEEEFEETEYRSNPTTTTTTAAPTKNNVYYNGAATFRSRDRYPTNGGEANGFQPQGMSDTRLNGGATFNSRAYGGEPNGFQPQGLSDTRNLENGKYFYDVNTEKYSNTHPYESLKGVRVRNEYSSSINNNNRNFFGNNENYQFNNENSINGGFQDQEEFQLDDNNAMP